MTARKSIFEEALGLPLHQRAGLARELLLSLEDEPLEDPKVVERAWAEEVERRLRQIDEGEANLYSWDSVQKELGAAVRTARRARKRSAR
ncbi:MAG: addiction module protein [Myxococcales bacterium]|nr:addiction module protein [Myxococcales bacterium]